MIFVDTSFFYASIDTDDHAHETAVKLIDQLASTALITTNHVRGETWTLLNRRNGHHVAVEFLQSLEASPSIEVASVDTDTEEAALDWLHRHDEREYSFIDATSFLFMQVHGLTRALAFDGDFAAAGFTELRP